MKKFILLFTTLSIVFAMIGTFTVFSDDTDITEISTLAELEAFRDDVNNGNTYEGKTVRLTADIDMSEKYGEGKESWTPINTFAGTFDGNGHKICNLYYYDGTEEYDTENPVGFFVFNNGTIKNLGIEGSITHMKYSMVGGIAAISNGMIENCYFSGSLTSPAHVGGITSSGNIKNCYNIGTIKGFHCVGGLTGTYSNIVNCYNAGNVIKMTEEDTSLFWESEYLGSISGAYNAESSMSDCFYLEGTYDIGAYIEEGTDTTTALTAEQFSDKSNFTDWDFDTVWDMDEALGRPVLRSNREQIPVTPTASPTATPTATPTASPMASPTASPTVTPTASPTATPTLAPTTAPTASPTASPTATPKPDFAFEDILKYHSGDYDVRFEKNIPKDVRLILAVYSEKGLIAVDSKIIYADEIGSYAEWIGNYRVSDDIKYVKLFAWDKTMKPLCGAKTYIDADIRYSNMD